MRKRAIEFEILSSMIEFSISENKIDLHNDFVCENIHYENAEEAIRFGYVNYDKSVRLKIIFYGVELAVVFLPLFFADNLAVLDTMYRGRCMVNGKLIDSYNGKGYFYLEFVDGQKLEFFSTEIEFCSNHVV